MSFKFNPFTNKLGRVLSAEEVSQLISWRDSVDDLASLPLTENTQGEARVVKDINAIYVWSVVASSGDINDWVDVSTVSGIAWGAISGTLGDQTDLQNELDEKLDENKANVWIERSDNAPAGDSQWRDIIWVPEHNFFIASSGGSSPGAIMTSPDGITWTGQTLPNSSSYQSVAYSPSQEKFVAVSSNGSTSGCITSPDGITWTGQTTPPGSWHHVEWGEGAGLFVAVGTHTNNIMTSPDGITWSARTAPGNQYISITWSETQNLFVAVGGFGIATSPDGITWTARTAPEANSWQDIVWAEELNLFIAVARTGTNRIMTSPDGITWASQTSDTRSWLGITWARELNLLVITGGGGGVSTSRDGITWTPYFHIDPDFKNMAKIAWSPKESMLVIVGNHGTTGSSIFTSHNPISEQGLADTTTRSFENKNDITDLETDTNTNASDITDLKQSSIQFLIDGGGSVIPTGIQGSLRVPFGCTINSNSLTAIDSSGSIVIDIWKDTFTNYPPTIADTITASAKPTISSSDKSEDSTLTGWTTTLNKGDYIYFNVDSVATIEKCLIELDVTRT